MKITKTLAIKLAYEYKLDLDIVPIDEWIHGLKTELEHGKKLNTITNVSNDDISITAKIALAHLIEDPRYYKFLKKMEEARDKYWSTHTKPNIFKS